MIKPIDKAEKPKLPRQLPENAKTKLMFLVFLILIGSFIVSQASHIKSSIASQTKDLQARVQEQDIPEPTSYVSLNEIKDQSDELIAQSTKKSQEVLGEATKIATKPAEIAQDYIYEITIEETIKKLFNLLPQRRQDALKEELFK